MMSSFFLRLERLLKPLEIFGCNFLVQILLLVYLTAKTCLFCKVLRQCR